MSRNSRWNRWRFSRKPASVAGERLQRSSRFPASFAAAVLGLLCVGRGLGVDPLPPELEKAPLAVQMQYREQQARQSDELKRQVAKERADEHGRFREAVAAAMEQEVAVRQQAMVRPAGLAVEAVGGATALAAPASEPATTNRGRNLVLFLVALGLIYQFRDQLFGLLSRDGK